MAMAVKGGFLAEKKKQANALLRGAQYAAAEQLCRQMLRGDGSDFETWQMLGAALWQQGKVAMAADALARAADMRPRHAEVRYQLGTAQLALRRGPEAIETLRDVVRLRAEHLNGHLMLGKALITESRYEEAAEAFQAALRRFPDRALLHSNLANVLADQGRLDEALESWRRALQVDPDYRKGRSNFLLGLNYDPHCDGETLYREHLAWAERHERPDRIDTRCVNARDRGRRLRVGYVSRDFRDHAVSHFIEPVVLEHGRSGFEVYAFSDVVAADATTARIRSGVDVYRETHRLTDEQLAERVRADGIDILVDLAGHTAGNRLAAFALRPAPVQVSYLGYPNTTGMQAMDYRLTDSWADPPGASDHLHTERLWRLPQGFLCYRPPLEAPEVAALPAETNGAITFGAFNYAGKTNREVLAAWARILDALPDARLLFKNKSFTDASTCERYLKQLEELGVDRSRVETAGATWDKSEHLATYHRVDVALDTFPYNGTTTTCDSLWMGAPVVTLAGEAHRGRVGTGLLARVGLDGLAARSSEEYVEIAVALASDRRRLAELRRGLRARMTSHLCDAEAFTRELERAYREMWSEWCRDTG